MTTPFTRGLSRVLMIATHTLFQQSNAGPVAVIAPGQVFWADVVDAPGLAAGSLATIAPDGTPAPPPEPPFTVNAVPGLGAATANSSPAPLRQPVTVTAAQTVNPASTGTMLRVKVLTGVFASPAGGSGAGLLPSNTVSVTTTKAGSVVYGAALDNGEHNGFSYNAATTAIDNIGDPAENASYGSFRSAATVAPGAVVLGTTDSSSSRIMAALEILPWGTIAEDASSPAVAFSNVGSTVTTAAFLPPKGSLLVAMACAEAFLPIGMSLSTVGLAWTQQISVSNVVGGAYAGVWTAPVTF